MNQITGEQKDDGLVGGWAGLWWLWWLCLYAACQRGCWCDCSQFLQTEAIVLPQSVRMGEELSLTGSFAQKGRQLERLCKCDWSVCEKEGRECTVCVTVWLLLYAFLCVSVLLVFLKVSALSLIFNMCAFGFAFACQIRRVNVCSLAKSFNFLIALIPTFMHTHSMRGFTQMHTETEDIRGWFMIQTRKNTWIKT